MAIFRVKARDGSVEFIVRAFCITCARNAAAKNAGAEGPSTWRDANKSTVELMRGSSGSGQDGKTEIIKRIEHAAA